MFVFFVQNPNNCNSASVHVCNMVNQAGFGSELHTILKCFLPALGSPNYGPRAGSGPRRHFIRPAASFYPVRNNTQKWLNFFPRKIFTSIVVLVYFVTLANRQDAEK